VRPINFKESNLELGRPASMTEEECRSLHVHRCKDGRLISCWKLTPEEIEKVAKTGEIWLHVWGGITQPPVALEVENPFREATDEEAEEKSRQD